MARLSLGERQYRHRRYAVRRQALDLVIPAGGPYERRAERRWRSALRRSIRRHFATPALIHNGRKAR
ncbi:hypothetical protein SEA_MAGUCO_51 [Arthrobacter phage MaGuCo]|uniref:Uncharacterized protein n=1 Tax=Arthrobacter phage MaGuCo TaxID=3038363 RepID=A0AAF0GKV4_9CAUD|nr:hypothetical protein SEA_MAGUCO_51 [Arthrobacter phage MaGuCo]